MVSIVPRRSQRLRSSRRERCVPLDDRNEFCQTTSTKEQPRGRLTRAVALGGTLGLLLVVVLLTGCLGESQKGTAPAAGSKEATATGTVASNQPSPKSSASPAPAASKPADGQQTSPAQPK